MTSSVESAPVTRSDAEQWRELAEWKDRTFGEGDSLLAPVRAGVVQIRTAVTDGLRAIPGVAQLDGMVHDLLHQLAAAGAGAGANTLRRETVFARFREHGHDVTDFKHIRGLEVTDIQAVLPRLDLGYVAVAGLQGGVTSALISSGAVAAAGGGVSGLGGLPGVGVAVAALTGDAVLTVATCTRAVAHVAAYYGYDVTKRSEQVLALAVLAVGLATDADGPAAYEEVSSLIRTRAKDKEKRKRQQRQLRRLARAVHQRLLSQIGRRELVQFVPVIGVGVSAVLSARLLAHVIDAAEHLYRERFLHDRYDLPFGTEPPEVEAPVSGRPVTAAPVAELL